eukprot:3300989-Pyramimonas_sp.AAC.1
MFRRLSLPLAPDNRGSAVIRRPYPWRSRRHSGACCCSQRKTIVCDDRRMSTYTSEYAWTAKADDPGRPHYGP